MNKLISWKVLLLVVLFTFLFLVYITVTNPAVKTVTAKVSGKITGFSLEFEAKKY